MKKLIGTVAVAALIASAAFAEISLGSWLRVVAAPVAGNGDEIISGMTNSWGWGARVARINFDATSDDGKVGFSMGVYNDAYKSNFDFGDNYVIWAKPWDWLRVSFGKWDYTTFRGDLCFGSWNWIRPNNWLFGDEGLTFDPLGNQLGMQFEIAPVEGLLIMWNLPLMGVKEEKMLTYGDDKIPTGEEEVVSRFDSAYKMLQAGHIAAKYTIGDIGTIKAGWDGDEWGDDDARKYGNVNVAFDLTAVENLYVTVGAKIGIASSDYKETLISEEKLEDKCYKFIKVGLGASYQILDNLKVAANFGLQTYQTDSGRSGVSAKHKPDFQFGVGVDFGFTDALTLNADFRGLIKGDYEWDGKTTWDPDPQFSFLVGLQYSISSNGYVGIGFQGTTNGCGFPGTFDAYKEKDKDSSDAFCWAVPLVISCWF